MRRLPTALLMRPGFEHHGQFNSETARKALCRRGGLAAARVHRTSDWQHQKTISALGCAARTRQRLERQLPKFEADWERVFGEPLWTHLLRQREGSLHRASLWR